MMQVNFNSPNFTSRNPSVRQADRICRMVNSQFPAISTSKLSKKIGNSPKYKKFYSYIFDLSHKINSKVRDKVALVKNDIIARYKKIAELVQKERLANCDEYTRLASLICSANNIKSQPLIVKYLSNKNLDVKPCNHVALALIPEDELIVDERMSNLKDVIIIDPWLGIADYAPNVALKYKNIFPEYLNLKYGDEPLMSSAGFNYKLKEDHFEEVRKEFPEFVIKK